MRKQLIQTKGAVDMAAYIIKKKVKNE